MEQTNETIYKNRYLILANIVMLTFMACLDGSIVNVTLPIMSDKLMVTTEAISWVVTSYLITITATILIFGRLGDFYGKTKVFMAGIAIFTLGSLLCGMTDSFAVLILARVIQAIGGAGAMATNQGIITQVFPANERGRALGIAGSVVALGTLAGPPIGGFIVSFLSWKYIFLINVPIGIFTVIMGIKVLPKHNKAHETEAKKAFPFEIFRNQLFTLSLFCAFISFIAISCSSIIQPFYLQNCMKMSPGMTGLIMMVYPLALAIVAPISGYLSDKIGSEFLTFIGLMLTSAGLFLASTLNEHSTIWSMIIFILVMSIGNGMFQSPNTSLIMSTVPRSALGAAGSINALVRNLGMVIGIEFSTLFLYFQMSRSLGSEVWSYVPGRDDVFVYGMRSVYIAAAIVCAIGAGLTYIRLYGKKKALA